MKIKWQNQKTKPGSLIQEALVLTTTIPLLPEVKLYQYYKG